MKVKNIMFSGFMAAIMMSATAGVANAAVSVASKGYVDSKTVGVSYADDSTNYLGSVTGVKNATVELDKQIKSVSDVANGAVKSLDFESFQTTNTTAIADAKAAGTAASDALDAYKTEVSNTYATQSYVGDVTSLGYEGVTTIVGALNQLKNSTPTNEGYEAMGNQITALQNADAAIDGRLDVLEGDGEGSVAKAEADAKAYADSLAGNYDAAGTAAALVKALEEGTVATNTSAISTLKSDVETNYAKTADVTSAIATAKGEAINAAAGDATTKADKALTDAKAYTADEIAKLSALAKADFPQECTAGEKMCVLTLTTGGAYAWVALTEPSEDQ